MRAQNAGYTLVEIIIVVLTTAALVGLGSIVVVQTFFSDDEGGSIDVDQLDEDSEAAKARRDSFRRTDIARLASAATTFAVQDSNGEAPSFEDVDFGKLNKYLDTSLIDPTTNQPYDFVQHTPDVGEIHYSRRKVCADDGTPTDAQTLRQAVFYTKLETDRFYCEAI